eukprot:4713153-Alexandrium_andersonii.AAC.1
MSSTVLQCRPFLLIGRRSTGSILQALLDVLHTRNQQARLVAVSLVTDPAGVWTPLVAATAACSIWGSRAAQVASSIDWIGPPC